MVAENLVGAGTFVGALPEGAKPTSLERRTRVGRRDANEIVMRRTGGGSAVVLGKVGGLGDLSLRGC